MSPSASVQVGVLKTIAFCAAKTAISELHPEAASRLPIASSPVVRSTLPLRHPLGPAETRESITTTALSLPAMFLILSRSLANNGPIHADASKAVISRTWGVLRRMGHLRQRFIRNRGSSNSTNFGG